MRSPLALNCLATWLALPILCSTALATPRSEAIALHKEAKVLRANGDLDGALAKYVEAHDLFANLKVAQWVVNRYIETKREEAALAMLEAIIAEERPASGVPWAIELLPSVAKVVDARKKAVEDARRKAEAAAKAKAEAEAKAKADAAAKALADAEAKAKAKEAARVVELRTAKEWVAELARQASEERWRRRFQAREDARLLPNILLISGGLVALGGLVARTEFAVSAERKRTEAADCYSTFLEAGPCAQADQDSLVEEADSANAQADVAAIVGAVGVVTVGAGAILLWRAGSAGDEAAASHPVLTPTPGGVSLAGRFWDPVVPP